MSLKRLTSDIAEMIDISNKIGENNTILFYCNDLKDKRNYNKDKVKTIKEDLCKLHIRLSFLRDKWSV